MASKTATFFSLDQNFHYNIDEKIHDSKVGPIPSWIDLDDIPELHFKITILEPPPTIEVTFRQENLKSVVSPLSLFF